jgi:hypothetical protein
VKYRISNNFATHSAIIQHQHNLATQFTLATLSLHLLTMVVVVVVVVVGGSKDSQRFENERSSIVPTMDFG